VAQSPAVICQGHGARRTHYACRRRLTPLAGDKIDAPAACAVLFRPYCGDVITRTRNVSEYMLVLALCLVSSLHYHHHHHHHHVFDNLAPTGEKIADTLDKLSDKTHGIEQRIIENIDRIEMQLIERINAVEQLLEKKTESDTTQWQLVEKRLKKLEERPTVIEEVQERIEFKVDQLKRNMDEPMVQVVQGAVEGVLQQDKEEEMEIERRVKMS